MQAQIRYLTNHLTGLARGTKLNTDIVLADHTVQTLKTAVMRSNGKHLANLFLALGDEA